MELKCVNLALIFAPKVSDSSEYSVTIGPYQMLSYNRSLPKNFMCFSCYVGFVGFVVVCFVVLCLFVS